MQEEVRAGKVVVRKVDGTKNPADLMTKFLGKVEVIDRLRRMGIVWKSRDGGYDNRWTEVDDNEEVKGG